MEKAIEKNLKSLQTSLSKNEEEKRLLIEKRNKVSEQRNALTNEIELKIENIKSLKIKIEQLKKKEVIVSEHAILRYLERVEGVDIEKIKERILNEEFKKAYNVLGDGKYPIENKFFVRVKGNVIVTVLPNK